MESVEGEKGGFFYRATLRRARLRRSMTSVCLSDRVRRSGTVIT